MTIFFTSDSHFYHNNIIEYENRPFSSLEEMHEKMIEVWNDTVSPSDTVHHLGDFCFGGYKRWTTILDQLNGKIILYKGNHDQQRVLNRLSKDGYFKEIHTVGDYFKSHTFQIWLTHYPMEIGLRPRKFSVHGHIHSRQSKMINQVNVGVDSPIFKHKPFGQPISESELFDHLEKINYDLQEQFEGHIS